MSNRAAPRRVKRATVVARRRIEAPRSVSHPHVEQALQYARDVVAGRVVACQLVKLACKRQLADLKKQKSRAFAYRFDEAKCERICRFVEYLPHVKGQWARRRELIVLQPWQCFILCCVFGWLRKADGLRRFRETYLEIPRKNAKSTLSAAVGLYMLTDDDEHGAEIYCGATTRDQAHEVFRPAKIMAERTGDFREHYGVEVFRSTIHVSDTASRLQPLIGKPGDGSSPSCAIVDEYHEHSTDEQVDTMRTGMGAREQPLLWQITTAGVDISGPCYSRRSEVIRMLRGETTNDELFGLIYTIDAKVDWTTDLALRTANPNYDVSVSAEFLQREQREAIQNARKQTTFKNKHLNVWTTARDAWMNMELYDRCSDPTLTLESCKGLVCFGGLDLASKVDLASFAKVFRKDIKGQPHYFAFVRSYVPQAKADEPENEHYRGWIEEGWLTATDGNVIDYDTIKDEVLDDHAQFRIQQMGYDPWGAEHLTQQLQTKGIDRVEVPPKVQHLSEPMKWLEAIVKDGRFHHNGDPVLRWAMSNITAKEDAAENIFPRKDRRESKIDPALAVIMAFSRAILNKPKPRWRIT